MFEYLFSIDNYELKLKLIFKYKINFYNYCKIIIKIFIIDK